MIKTILIDGDGIVINKPMMFSERLAKDYGIPYDAILPFFKNEFQPCLVGKADLKEIIKPYLAKWGWKKSVDELLQYWLESEDFVDKKVVDVIQKCRQSGVKVYMHSNQEKYRTDYMMGKMEMGKIVDGIFSSAYLGVKKPQPEFWQAVLSKIQPAAKQEVLVWDDDEENIASAKKFGFEAELYKGFDGFVKTIRRYFPNIIISSPN